MAPLAWLGSERRRRKRVKRKPILKVNWHLYQRIKEGRQQPTIPTGWYLVFRAN